MSRAEICFFCKENLNGHETPKAQHNTSFQTMNTPIKSKNSNLLIASFGGEKN